MRIETAPTLPASYDLWWTIMMLAFAAGIVVVLIALIRAYLRTRRRDQEMDRLRGDVDELRERDSDS